MSELKPCPCPICGAALKIYRPEDWNPSFCDPDSGGDPYNAVCDCGFSFSTGTYDYAAFVSALNRRAEPANDPLTLEQLRKMHGEPVWVVPNRGIAKWYLVDVANDCCSTCDMDVVDFELYGPQKLAYGWLAYAHKPEGSENE